MTLSSAAGATSLVEGVLARDRAAVARAISVIERGETGAGELLRGLRRNLGRAHRIGITGPPGAGKSSLVSALGAMLVAQGKSIGVLAIDPSSQFTQGAVLGDRVRMAELDRAEGIFIRSMATRGQSGGLSPRTDAAADVLDAAGYDWVFIESVGVGQVELDIRNLVDTTLVVLVPESGDQVQAIKAGLMEIADLYVVNKCDRPGAGAMVAAVQSSVALQHHPDPAWLPRVMGAAVINSEGLAEILTELERHRQHLSRDGRLLQGRRLGLMARLRKRIEQQLAARLHERGAGPELEQGVERILSGEESLEQVAERCLSEWVQKLAGKTPRGAGK